MVNEKVKLSKANVLLIIVAGLASYMDAALLVSLGVALPIWTKYLSLNSWMVGLVSTMLTVAVAVGSFVGGWLSDRFGRVTVFNADIFFVAVGSLIIAVAHNTTLLLVGVVIAGLASGADLPTSLAVISERMSSKVYGRAISSTQIFWTVGILLSQFIGFITANSGMGSPAALFGWIGLVALVNWCVRVFSKRFKTIETDLVVQEQATEDSTTQTTKKYSLRQLLHTSGFLVPMILLTVFYLFWNLPANTWGSFVNYFLVTIDGRTQAYSTIVALIANIVCLLVNLIYLKVSDTKYRYPAMYVGIAVALVSFVIAGIYSDRWQVFTVVYIFYSGSTVLCGEALYKIWSQTFYPVDARATMTGFSYGLVRVLTAVFSLVTPTLMGYSPELLLWIMVGCTVLFGTCAITIVMIIKKMGLKDPTMKAVAKS
ncbi:MFS transporter [Lactiplantibacillus pentosus]|uniref:MFS transporter n=1 Tax=Lactiplantibacillus pentosus TaxID=1589 RepID=UPI00132FFC1E|nr:MFS transporter [Lactiplantibacillus pentosus]MBQ0834908.1 MFS transporter [Lactiplantibacillus pentosus]MBU7464354.1 MFS transporter [Lactiplantibacillus pentosus]MBU7490159.1 MFS transporter [Lactiplantibacillus pentosus]MBU7495174.1 MFS transporter [Lactiplantibacillus pentosus]MBU7521155.1 MFS transporter [Lactiplantibacillus pentosus]